MANGPMFNSTSFSFNKGGWPHFQLHHSTSTLGLQTQSCNPLVVELPTIWMAWKSQPDLKAPRFSSMDLEYEAIFQDMFHSPLQKHPMTGTNICKHLRIAQHCSPRHNNCISSVVVLIQFLFQSWHWVLGLKTESSFSQSPLTEEIPNLLRFEIRVPQP